jgi:hypothetical protein
VTHQTLKILPRASQSYFETLHFPINEYALSEKTFNLLPQNNTDNHKGQSPKDAGGRHDDPRPPEGRFLLNVGRADEGGPRVTQRRPVDRLRRGELSVKNDGAVVDAARCTADLELVGVDGGQVVHDVLQKNGKRH